MIKKIIILVGLLVLIASGCANIPPEAITLNKEVSKGISALEENAKQMTDAWEETAYNVLDERWDKIYDRAEIIVRGGLPAGAVLNAQQLKEVAGVATLIRDDVRDKIRAEANKMRKIINTNAKTISGANNSITELLVSANAALKAQKSLLKDVVGLTPIPDSVISFVESKLSDSVIKSATID